MELIKEIGLTNKCQTEVMLVIKNSMSNKEHSGNAIDCSGVKRTWAQLPTVYNFSPRASNALFWPLQALYTHIAQTCKAPIHKNVFKRENSTATAEKQVSQFCCPKPTNHPHLPHHSNTWSPTQNSREVPHTHSAHPWQSSYPSFHGNPMKLHGPRILNQFELPNQLNSFTKMHWNHSALCS